MMRTPEGAVSEKVQLLLQEAIQRANGWSQWGGEDDLRGAIAAYVRSTFADLEHSRFADGSYFENALWWLAQRQKVIKCTEENPEIRDVPITRPLFVVGLPRSGTTFLHRLLASDPCGRAPRFWELLEPAPPPDPRTEANDPRIPRAERVAKLVNTKLAAMHHMSAAGPEECHYILSHTFANWHFCLAEHRPTYYEWLLLQDMAPRYAYYKLVMQVLCWQFPDRHLLLKCPTHVGYLREITRIFPDANFVVTHRNPLETFPSDCSLWAAVRSWHEGPVERYRLGQTVLKRFEHDITGLLEARKTLPNSRFFDVRYDDLTAQPKNLVKAIYAHFGYDFSQAMETALDTLLHTSPQHKFGVHHYALEDYGVDPDDLNAAFCRYRSQYGV